MASVWLLKIFKSQRRGKTGVNIYIFNVSAVSCPNFKASALYCGCVQTVIDSSAVPLLSCVNAATIGGLAHSLATLHNNKLAPYSHSMKTQVGGSGVTSL